MKNPLRGSATITKRHDTGLAVITVSVRMEGGEFDIESKFEKPVVIDPTKACAAQYKSIEHLLHACDVAAQSGVLSATRGFRELSGRVVFTVFECSKLAPGFATGFTTAAALACFQALRQPERARELDLQGWKIKTEQKGSPPSASS